MIKTSPLSCLLCILLYCTVPVMCKAESTIIDQLTAQIAAASSDEEKGRLYMYRARNHANREQFAKALADYNNALATTHKGWIHLERSRFFLTLREYALAARDAEAAKEETPTLAYQAEQIIEVATNHLEIIYHKENPPEIVLDREVNPSRKSRFDVARERSGTLHSAGNDFVAWRKKREATKKKSSPPPKRVVKS